MLSTNNIIEGSFCLYVVTFVVFLVLSERLEQATSKHVGKFFWNIKTVFQSNTCRTEQNVKSRQSLIISKLSRRKAWFLNMVCTLFFLLFLLFIGIIVIAQKTKFGYRLFCKTFIYGDTVSCRTRALDITSHWKLNCFHTFSYDS